MLIFLAWFLELARFASIARIYVFAGGGGGIGANIDRYDEQNTNRPCHYGLKLPKLQHRTRKPPE